MPAQTAQDRVAVRSVFISAMAQGCSRMFSTSSVTFTAMRNGILQRGGSGARSARGQMKHETWRGVRGGDAHAPRGILEAKEHDVNGGEDLNRHTNAISDLYLRVQLILLPKKHLNLQP